MTPYFIGVDSSLANTAVCVLSKDGQLVLTAQSNTLGLSSKQPYDRLIRLEQFISDILKKYPGSFVGYEDYSFGSTHRAFALGELGGLLKTRIYTYAAEMVVVPPTVLKQFGAGHGAADKKRMIDAACEECPELLNAAKVTDDICDAYFLAKFALFTCEPKSAVRIGGGNLRSRLEVVSKGSYERSTGLSGR